MINLMQFKNFGYLLTDLSENQLNPIKEEINYIKNNSLKAISFNKNLVGNLEHEYELIESKDYINSLLIPYINEYEKYYNYIKNINILNRDLELKIEKLWVNFQKKYEFNPLHIHAGVFSFVIWIDIPYNIKDEMENKSSKNSLDNIPGHFQFVAINSMGELIKENIPADKTYNGKLCIFPSKMNHCVYPFYTSDEYRITVSGNFKFEI